MREFRSLRPLDQQVQSALQNTMTRVLQGVTEKRDEILGAEHRVRASEETLRDLAQAERRFAVATLAERVVLPDKQLRLLSSTSSYIDAMIRLLDETQDPSPQNRKKAENAADEVVNFIEREVAEFRSADGKMPPFFGALLEAMIAARRQGVGSDVTPPTPVMTELRKAEHEFLFAKLADKVVTTEDGVKLADEARENYKAALTARLQERHAATGQQAATVQHLAGHIARQVESQVDALIPAHGHAA